MSPLARLLRRRIASRGPISVAEYMAEALAHPRHGYYQRRDPFGAKGDFITAPEISQMFGEMIGLWSAVVWQAIGSPQGLNLIELGPGRGTLMADALRAAERTMPDFVGELCLHLVETSPVLRDHQRRALADLRPVIEPTWHESLTTVPVEPSILIANEFFDALPVRQYLRAVDGWRERMVGLDQHGVGFEFVSGPVVVPDSSFSRFGTNVCDVVERCPEAEQIARAIGERVARDGGAALIIDYGHPRSAPGDTLQAVSRHTYLDVLSRPGEVDLTHHVDFQALAAAATGTGAFAFGPISQGMFLGRIGIEQRAAILLKSANADQATDIRTAVRRLTHPREMGTLFKVLAVTSFDQPAPPGFDVCPP